MTLATLCLMAVLCPQPDRLVLPPPPPKNQQQASKEARLSEAERFHRDVFKLRRSAALSKGAEEMILQEIGSDYRRPAELAMAFARRDSADLVHGLLKVIDLYGKSSQAEELLYLLHTRPFGAATRATVQLMAKLAEDGAKAALMECLVTRYTGVRKAATDLLLARIDRSDLQSILELSQGDDADVIRKALFLLGALPYDPARARLLEALSNSDPTIAATACTSLVDHGPEVADDLQPIVERPAMDRSFGYAALALTLLEDRTGQVLLTDEMLPYLRVELTGSDAFMQTCAALALSNMAFRSDDVRGIEFGDREIVDGLLQVVAPKGYVSNISLLQQPAARKLVQFTGNDFRGRNLAWRVWWDEARPGFTGTRLALRMSDEAGATALLKWTDSKRAIYFRGSAAAAPPADEDDEGLIVDNYILTGAEFAAMVERLRAQGFMTQGLVARAAATQMLPVGRVLDLQVANSRARVAGPVTPARWLDVLEAEIDAVTERERWQLYRDPLTEPDAGGFWETERAWLAAHDDRRERENRLKERILIAYPALDAPARARARRHLLAIPEIEDLLTTADAGRMLSIVNQSKSLDDEAFQLLEVALLVRDDQTSTRVLQVVDSHFETGGKEALPRVFALLGAERVRRAIADPQPRVRTAAILEVANLRDVAAIEQLRVALHDPEPSVANAAIYCLGILAAQSAKDELLAMQADPDTAPQTRRTVWVALGRIGGEPVFSLLQSAVASPDLQDQLAAIQALGELQEERAAHVLAQIFVAHGLNPRGTQAMASLQKMGALLAGPALRRYLGVRDPRVRREIVMLLAEFQDPTVVPEMLALMQEEPSRARVALLLSGITGIELTGVNDRVTLIKEWWRTHKDLPQASWFLDALRRNEIATTLTLQQLAPRMGNQAVPELTRILVGTELPHIRVLAAALLRETTERDFGLISMQTSPSQLQAIADRYRFYADAEQRGEGR